jgi:hypothetical protein
MNGESENSNILLKVLLVYFFFYLLKLVVGYFLKNGLGFNFSKSTKKEKIDKVSKNIKFKNNFFIKVKQI